MSCCISIFAMDDFTLYYYSFHAKKVIVRSSLNRLIKALSPSNKFHTSLDNLIPVKLETDNEDTLIDKPDNHEL